MKTFPPPPKFQSNKTALLQNPFPLSIELEHSNVVKMLTSLGENGTTLKSGLKNW